METFIQALLLLLDAPKLLNTVILSMAKLLATDGVWLVPAILGIGWL